MERRDPLLVVLGVVFASAVVGVWKWGEQGTDNSSRSRTTSVSNKATALAVLPNSKCDSCHDPADDLDRQLWDRWSGWSQLTSNEWRRSANVSGVCGGCHQVPAPSDLPRESWARAVTKMQEFAVSKRHAYQPKSAWNGVLHYFLHHSQARYELPKGSSNSSGNETLRARFEYHPILTPEEITDRGVPRIGDVIWGKLSDSGPSGAITCDTGNQQVLFALPGGDGRLEYKVLASLPYPARAVIKKSNDPATYGLVVACLGTMESVDTKLGGVFRLRQSLNGSFKVDTLISGLCRVSDVAMGDLDQDGDDDIVVGAFGYLNEGEVGVLWNDVSDTYSYQPLLQRSGAVRVIVADMDDDKQLDLVVGLAQEHEEIWLFRGTGTRKFEPKILWKANSPAFGLAGLSVGDLDGDGDQDIAFTNGDNLDQPKQIARSYHGVQWLERSRNNRGELSFIYHDIIREPGAYGIDLGDVDGDGRLDIAVSCLFNDWADPNRPSLILLRNEGGSRFSRYDLATKPTHVISVRWVDADRDGLLDILSTSMHGFPPFDRMGAVGLWKQLAK